VPAEPILGRPASGCILADPLRDAPENYFGRSTHRRFAQGGAVKACLCTVEERRGEKRREDQ